MRIWEENLNDVKVADWMLPIERGFTKEFFSPAPGE